MPDRSAVLAQESYNMTSTTQILARYIVNAKPEDIPAAVEREGQRCLLHWIGCSIGGSHEASVDVALAAVQEIAGAGAASLLGRGERLDLAHAAFINGVSADVLSFSDTHPPTLIHAGGVIGSAALALAERHPTSGRDFLNALIIGYEVACRIGLSIYPWHYTRGWHITGTAGIFGAAAAAGKILRLDEQHMLWALGIAATQSAGLREMFGSMSKNLHIGRAAQNGLVSALFASKGFTSSQQSLEAPRGFTHVLGENPDLDVITRNLGKTFEILLNTYKPYPCGVVIHPIIEGCVNLATAHDLKPGDIRSVSLRCNPLVIELCGKERPATTLEAKLSVYHSAAAALIARRMTDFEYRPAFIERADVLALRARVAVTVERKIREDETEVVVELDGGARFTCHIDHVIGSAARPMSDADMERKFRGLTEPVLPQAQVDQLIESCRNVAQLDDVAVLARLAAKR
jgi:2-methylcitrate dehydratase PrpD